MMWRRVRIENRTQTTQMKAKRRRHNPEFKARMALEALRGERPIAEIAKEYAILPGQVSGWKKTTLKSAADRFEPGRKGNEEEAPLDRFGDGKSDHQLVRSGDRGTSKNHRAGSSGTQPDRSRARQLG